METDYAASKHSANGNLTKWTVLSFERLTESMELRRYVGQC